jgi:hypothetical protein
MSKTKAQQILKQLPTTQSPDVLEKLQEAFKDKEGNIDLDLLLFYVSWLKHGMVAQYAYKELHPEVTDASAAVLGSRELSKVNRELVMSAYKLDLARYFAQLDEGLAANKLISARVIHKKDSPTSQADGESPATSRTDDFIEVPDHYARKPYHDKLGKLLGIESEKGPTVAVQVNNYTPEQMKDDELNAIIT